MKQSFATVLLKTVSSIVNEIPKCGGAIFETIRRTFGFRITQDNSIRITMDGSKRIIN